MKTDFISELAKLLRLTEDESIKLEELLDDHVNKLVENRLDQEFNRGDYRRD